MSLKNEKLLEQHEGRKLFVLEHKSKSLLPVHIFYKRLWSYIAVAGILMIFSLSIGVLGYHFLGGLHWVDSILNASMILGGMGPVDILQKKSAKLFASVYALYSGMLLLSVFGIIMTPVIHRILHKMHLDE